MNSHRENCSKCHGKGEVPNGHSTMIGMPVFEECYACMGMGWIPVGIVFDDWDVEVSDGDEPQEGQR